MPATPSQVERMLDAAIDARAAHTDPIGAGRRLFLIHVKDLIREHGFPLPDTFKLDACAMPYLFQEFNYDGCSWSDKTADLGHLADMVDIDVIVWSDGRSRQELTAAEYNDYVNFCHKAIEHRRRR